MTKVGEEEEEKKEKLGDSMPRHFQRKWPRQKYSNSFLPERLVVYVVQVFSVGVDVDCVSFCNVFECRSVRCRLLYIRLCLF